MQTAGEDICRQRSGNAQTTEVSALFKSCVGAQCDVSVSVRVHVTATETLRRCDARGCVQTAGGVYGDNVHQIKSSND